MIRIELQCKGPIKLARLVKCNQEFKTFVELWNWIDQYYRTPRGLANDVLWSVAKDNHYTEYSRLIVKSDAKIRHDVVIKLAKDVGFLSHGISPLTTKDPRKGLAFAQALDNQLKSVGI